MRQSKHKGGATLVPLTMTSDKKKIVSNISKWFPKSASLKSSSDKIFANAKQLERELLILGNKFSHATHDSNLLDPAVSTNTYDLKLDCAKLEIIQIHFHSLDSVMLAYA